MTAGEGIVKWFKEMCIGLELVGCFSEYTKFSLSIRSRSKPPRRTNICLVKDLYGW